MAADADATAVSAAVDATAAVVSNHNTCSASVAPQTHGAGAATDLERQKEQPEAGAATTTSGSPEDAEGGFAGPSSPETTAATGVPDAGAGAGVANRYQDDFPDYSKDANEELSSDGGALKVPNGDTEGVTPPPEVVMDAPSAHGREITPHGEEHEERERELAPRVDREDACGDAADADPNVATATATTITAAADSGSVARPDVKEGLGHGLPEGNADDVLATESVADSVLSEGIPPRRPTMASEDIDGVVPANPDTPEEAIAQPRRTSLSKAKYDGDHVFVDSAAAEVKPPAISPAVNDTETPAGLPSNSDELGEVVDGEASPGTSVSTPDIVHNASPKGSDATQNCEVDSTQQSATDGVEFGMGGVVVDAATAGDKGNTTMPDYVVDVPGDVAVPSMSLAEDADMCIRGATSSPRDGDSDDGTLSFGRRLADSSPGEKRLGSPQGVAAGVRIDDDCDGSKQTGEEGRVLVPSAAELADKLVEVEVSRVEHFVLPIFSILSFMQATS